MSITPTWENPFTLEGVLARFWKRIACRPDMCADHRRHLLYLYTYSYGNELWLKQHHKRDRRAEWHAIRGQRAYRFRGSCWACEAAPPTHWHHIVPLARGGDNRFDNLVPLCRRCHHTVHHQELAVPA
jgi:5-methylcytosine-specific restriction endonuclease McrA